MTSSTERLRNNERLVLDGGMGQELAARGVDTTHGLWSAQALIAEPETVLAVHRSFIDAGADVITTNTYASTRRRLREGDDEQFFERLNRLACKLACRARDESGRDVLIAGSLPPIHGSYRPDQVRPFGELEPQYREQAEILAECIDFFICETMSTASEALAAASGAAATGKPVWVSWTVADDGSGTLRSGESTRTAIEALSDVEVEALLFNCSMPESIDAALPELARHANRPFGAYANGFTAIGSNFEVADGANVPDRREELTPDLYAAHAKRWLKAGASIVGGCCEVGPAHIAAVRGAVRV